MEFKMKKYWLSLLVIPLLLLLSACGGGGNDLSDSSANTQTSVEVAYGGAEVNGTSLSMNFTFDRQDSGGADVSIGNFALAVQGTKGCRVVSANFDPSRLTIFPGTLKVQATLSASDCDLEEYDLSYDETITISGHSKTVKKHKRGAISGGESGGGGGNTNGYLTIIPEANLTITKSNSSYTINVALTKLNENGREEPATGETVVAEFLEPTYGTLSNYEAEVGSDGLAKFNYTSPSKFSGLKEATITFYAKADARVSAQTKLIFQPESVEKVEHLYIAPHHITITEANQTKEITVVTVNGGGVGLPSTVEVEQPNNGTDYGYFEPAGKIHTDQSGRAVVIYHAPENISGLNERNITFTEQSGLKQTLVIDFTTPSGEENAYEIGLQAPESLSVDSQGQITVNIHKLGREDEYIANDQVLEVNVTSALPNMLTFDNNKTLVQYSNEGVKPITIYTKTLSGTALIQISARINDGKKEVVLQKTMPVVVLSGPVTAMSIFYAYTSEDKDLGVYKNTYTIHAVDKYDNPARAGVALHPSVINGTKVIMARVPSAKISGGDTTLFEDQNINFVNHEVDTNDLLAIIPNEVRYEKDYLGDWTITDVSDHQLELAEPYKGPEKDQLSYVIGNSKRYLYGYGVATVDIKDKNNNGFTTDTNGNVQFEITFDPVLAGHTVTISANAYDTGERTGVSKIAALRWDKYSSSSEKVPNDGSDHNIILSLGISGGQERLIDVDIVPSSILSSSSQCYLDVNNPYTNLHTNGNGEIKLNIKTRATDTDIKECTISWSAKASGIYFEY